jgi:predicted dehydrogenase
MYKMYRENNISRRRFISSAAVAAATFTIVPRHVLGGQKYVAPSEKLNIAGIGIGGQGWTDLHGVSSENIVALCDVDDERAKRTYEEYPDAKRYRDYRIMLEKQKDIDAVVIATPDHMHAAITMAAIRMGKHVYCEKPLTHTVYEARKITQAARQAGVATQMGNQGHSGESIRLIKEWILDGAIGPVREVYCWTDRPKGWWPQGIGRPGQAATVPQTLDWDLWLGVAPQRPYHPDYMPFNWRGWWDFGCGALGDLGCHIIDVPFWALDLTAPTSIQAQSTSVNNETGPEAETIEYEFPARNGNPPVKLTWYDGGRTPPRPAELEQGRKMGDNNGGVLLVGEKGTIMSGCFGDGARIIPEEKMKAYKRPTQTLTRSKGHYTDWILACKGGDPASSNFDYAGPLTEVTLLGNAAVRAGGKLLWDSQNMKFTNNDDANKYIHFEYRKGWTL